MHVWLRRGLVGLGVLGGTGLVGLGAVVGWGLATWEATLAFPDAPFPAIAADTDPDAIARGRYLANGPAHCSQCHSTANRERPEEVRTAPLHGGLAFQLGPLGTLYARNLTSDAETGLGRRTDAELARVLRTGVLPEGQLSIFMRYSAASLSDEDLAAVLGYLRSLEPVRNEVPPASLTLLGKLVVKFAFSGVSPRPVEGPRGVRAGPEPTIERGAYLAEHVALCVACHTEVDPATFAPVGPKAGGGTVEPSHGDDAHMEYAPPNLTSHPTGITGKLDEEAFVARMLAGRTHATSIMPWEGVQQTTEDDLRSIYRYLRSLPPVDRDTGPSYRPVGWTP